MLQLASPPSFMIGRHIQWTGAERLAQGEALYENECYREEDHPYTLSEAEAVRLAEGYDFAAFDDGQYYRAASIYIPRPAPPPPRADPLTARTPHRVHKAYVAEVRRQQEPPKRYGYSKAWERTAKRLAELRKQEKQPSGSSHHTDRRHREEDDWYKSARICIKGHSYTWDEDRGGIYCTACDWRRGGFQSGAHNKEIWDKMVRDGLVSDARQE